MMEVGNMGNDTRIKVIVPDDDDDSGYVTARQIKGRYQDQVDVVTVDTVDGAVRMLQDAVTDAFTRKYRSLVVSDVHMGPGPRTYARFFDLYKSAGRGLPTVFTTSVIDQKPTENNNEADIYRPRAGETLGCVIRRTTPSGVPVIAMDRNPTNLYDAIESLIPELKRR
jgi:hypothetical protein